MKRSSAVIVAAATVLTGACDRGSASTPPTTTATVVTTTIAAPTTVATTTIPPTTIPATTVPPTTMTVAPTTTTAAVVQRLQLGRSVEGRPISAIERGTPGGTPVLVIGCIHGDEDAGVAVVDDLASAPVPDGIDLWLVPSINPDGEAHHTRANAHQVDLNRNFPQNWAPLGKPGDSQYAGTGPASEPETAAVVGLIRRVKPALTVWYHQDLNRIDVGGGRTGQVSRRYAELTGLPVEPVTGGTYTGTATQWQSATTPGGVAFIVELGPSLDGAGATTHADAILTIAESL